MSRAVVNELIMLLDQAFERPANAGPTDGWHSLLANLTNVRAEDWDWLPPNGKRSIHHLAVHCGFAFRVYANNGFGPGTLPVPGAAYEGPPGKEPVIAWLKEGHAILRDSIASTTDEALGEIMRTHWGEEKPRIWFLRTMIEHTLYHAGEINHIRALAQDNDA